MSVRKEEKVNLKTLNEDVRNENNLELIYLFLKLGISLLLGFLKFEGRRRISAKDSMKHPYFASLSQAAVTLGDSEYICFTNNIELLAVIF